MADTKLRMLQRRNDPEDQAKVLLERIRLGQLKLLTCKWCNGKGQIVYTSDTGRQWKHDCRHCHNNPALPTLELLAHCGHPGARVLVPNCVCVDNAESSFLWEKCISTTTFNRWVKTLKRWETSVLVIATLTASEIMIDRIEWIGCCDGIECSCRGMPIEKEWHDIERCIQALQGWLRDPKDPNPLTWVMMPERPMVTVWSYNLKRLLWQLKMNLDISHHATELMVRVNNSINIEQTIRDALIKVYTRSNDDQPRPQIPSPSEI